MSLAGSIRGLFAHAKDAGASKLATHAIQNQIKEYGEMIDLKINSQDKTIEVELLLKGEQQPMRFKIEKYELVDGPETDFIIVHRATASREWMDTLVQNFMVGKSIPIPHKQSRLLRLAL
ncbi:MAG: hypothetical protein ACO1QB_11940 [Verrucomicrobiales bacterium]